MKANNYLKRQVQKAIMNDLRSRREWRRWVHDRSDAALAQELGVDTQVITFAQKRQTRALTLQQLAWVNYQRDERHRGRVILALYSDRAIAKRYGVCEVTVRRYNAMLGSGELPMSYEDHLPREAA